MCSRTNPYVLISGSISSGVVHDLAVSTAERKPSTFTDSGEEMCSKSVFVLANPLIMYLGYEIGM